MDFKNVDLLQLQTNHMKQDITTKAISNTLTPEYKKICYSINRTLIRTNIDELSEEILDELAVEKNIFWYDANASIEVKRNLIRNANKVFKYLGTPYAIEQVIQDYFQDGYIEEYFEYNGQPYHFRVLTSNAAVTGELANQFTNAIEKVKRKSTKLDEVIILLSGNLNIYFGFALHTVDTITIRQEA